MRLSGYRFLVALLSAAFLASAATQMPAQAQSSTQSSTQSSPAEQAKAVDEALLDAMKQADQLGFKGRYELLEPTLEEAFDFAYMAQVSIGRHWQALDEGQKQALVDAFKEMSVATFASRFDGYSGERFELGEAKPGPRGLQVVPNRIVKSDGSAVAMNYLLREGDEGWRIVDVLLDAKFSELATRRSEYTSVVERQGFDALIQILEQKVAELGSSG